MNKPLMRLNPSLQRMIEETKKEMVKTLDINPSNMKGLNQIAQEKIADWARFGKQMNSKLNKNIKRPGLNEKFSNFMDEFTGIK